MPLSSRLCTSEEKRSAYSSASPSVMLVHVPGDHPVQSIHGVTDESSHVRSLSVVGQF